jgi:hypothetical protein
MAVTLLRALSWALAAILVWRLWRRTGRADAQLSTIIGLGLALRALAGAALFFVSYFNLPIASSLQLGEGFWFFAPDARGYYDYAVQAVAQGPGGIATANPSLPSVFYIQALATTMMFVGAVPPAGLLLNVLVYLATTALLVSWGARLGMDRAALRIAVAVVAFFPSWILWAAQPLKDPLFLGLMVAFTVTAARWIDTPPSGRLWRATAVAAMALGALLFAIAGIRWYVALLLAVATSLAWLVGMVRTRGRVAARSAALMAFLAVVVIVVPIGAGPYLPEFGQVLFRPRSATELVSVPLRAAEYVEDKRLDSVATTAGTMIEAPGRAVGANAAELAAGATPDDFREEARALSLFDRLFPRAVAMFLPRFVGTNMGWVEIGGGRGLWVVAELDTLFFDASLIAVGWILWRYRRQGFVAHPILAHVVVTTVVLTGMICYQTANFGTQFRLRSMVAIGVVLLIFAFAPRSAGAAARPAARP